MISNLSLRLMHPKHLMSAVAFLLALAWLVVAGAPHASAATTYTRPMTCQSTGVTGYSVTLVATWQIRADGLVDLVKTQTTHYLGVNVNDWANSETIAHRWSGVNKESATFDPISGVTTFFNDLYWNTPSASQVYLAASNNPRGIKCGPVVDNAI